MIKLTVSIVDERVEILKQIMGTARKVHIRWRRWTDSVASGVYHNYLSTSTSI